MAERSLFGGWEAVKGKPGEYRPRMEQIMASPLLQYFPRNQEVGGIFLII